jgi:CHASE2 domain-containing sensor protein
MIAVVLRRTTIMPWPWLTPLYMVMAVAALIWQILVYLKVFDIAGKKAWVHFIVCAILLFILACGVSTLIAIPLHSWFPSAPPIFRNTPAPEMYT